MRAATPILFMNAERTAATPDMMPVVGRLGKILGPRGMMPNPKLGSVTNDVTAAIAAAKGGVQGLTLHCAGFTVTPAVTFATNALPIKFMS